MMENGAIKKVNEPYLVDALSFSEAESRFTEEVAPLISGEFEVTVAKKTKIAEIFNKGNADRYYLVKCAFITLDELKDTEKKSVVLMLVCADSFRKACEIFVESMRGTMTDYEIQSVSETAIVDVFDATDSGNEKED